MTIEELLRQMRDISSDGSSEMDIQTELVQILQQLGWPRRQIKQNVRISDKDRADVVVYREAKGDPEAAILVEVKKANRTVDARTQLKRYADQLRPQFAIITDGRAWFFYYFARSGLLELSTHEDGDVETVVETLSGFTPGRLSGWAKEGALEFLDVVQDGLKRLAKAERDRLEPYLGTTVRALLQQASDGEDAADSVDSSVQSAPIQPASTHLAAPNAPLSGTSTLNASGVVRRLAPKDVNLTHTSVIEASFGGRSASKWNQLLASAVQSASQVGFTLPRLRALLSVQLVEGSSTDRGFKPVPGCGFSIQGVDSNQAWRNILRLAQELKQPVEVTFRYQDKPTATFPGEVAATEWKPSKG